MIGWYTDNIISKRVFECIPNIELKHISQFDVTQPQPSIFYGLLRGTSRAMHILQYLGIPFWYIDNGYKDAQYIDANLRKNMDGAYRVVKNDMIDTYKGPAEACTHKPRSCLVILPSPYSANYYQTTPDDWKGWAKNYLTERGILYWFRDKKSEIPLEQDIKNAESVLSFNSMSIMTAIEHGKAVMDTHGILRVDGFVYLKKENVDAYFADKQVTLEQLKQGGFKWN